MGTHIYLLDAYIDITCIDKYDEFIAKINSIKNFTLFFNPLEKNPDFPKKKPRIKSIWSCKRRRSWVI